MTTEGQMPDIERATEITMRTYTEIAGRYAECHQAASMPPSWQEQHRRFSAQVQASPDWQADSTLPILDAGCGPGRDSLIFAQQGFTVQAIDLSDAMLAEARQRTQGRPGAERITFTRMDMRHLALLDASCAGTWVSASFLHIPKKESRAVLAELVRVLAPDGPLMMMVKQADGGADERYDTSPLYGSPRFFARYHGGELWNLLEETGLRVLEVHAWGDKGEQGWLGALALKVA